MSSSFACHTGTDVLPVVLFHLDSGSMPGSYFGVDVVFDDHLSVAGPLIASDLFCRVLPLAMTQGSSNIAERAISHAP